MAAEGNRYRICPHYGGAIITRATDRWTTDDVLGQYFEGQALGNKIAQGVPAMEIMLIAPIYRTHIPIGRARIEGRASTRDGEYLTLLSALDGRWALGDNAGLITSSEGDPLEALIDGIDEEGGDELAALTEAVAHAEEGTVLPAGTIAQLGHEQSELLIEWGLAEPV